VLSPPYKPPLDVQELRPMTVQVPSTKQQAPVAGGPTERLSQPETSPMPPANKRMSVGSGLGASFGPPYKYQPRPLTSVVSVAPPAVMSRIETERIWLGVKSQSTLT